MKNCPCENCITLGICKSRDKNLNVSRVKIITNCTLLQKFLKLEINTKKIITMLSHEEANKRLEIIKEYLPEFKGVRFSH